MSDIWIGIQARSESTRLPGKIYMDIGGKSILERIYETCEQVTKNVVVLGHDRDSELIQYCNINKLTVFTVNKDEDDVASRYECFRDCSGASGIIRVTADCPFLSRMYLNEVYEWATGYHAVFCDIEGSEAEYMSSGAIDTLVNLTPEDKEHVTTSIKRNKGKYLMKWIHADLPMIKKLSVDTQEDLDNARKLWEEMNAMDKC